MTFAERLRQCWAVLSRPLSRVQATIGFCAGLISVGSVVLTFAGILHPSTGYGEVVTVVHEARSRRPIPEATVEILTPQDALVTTLTLPDEGRVRRSLKEGPYRVRVSHPRFAVETRQILVQAGQTAEIRFALGPRRMPQPPPSAQSPKAPEAQARVSESGLDSVKRFFRDLGR